MKKTILALAISAATMATGAMASGDGQQAGSQEGTTVYSANGNSLQIGGRAEARMSIMEGEIQDKSRARLDLTGKVNISDELYGIGFYEIEFQSNELDGMIYVDGTSVNDASEKNGFQTEKVYAGIGGNFGEVTYGKVSGALGIITDFTDIMAYHGGEATFKLYPGDTADNMLAYNGQFNNVELKASYRFADRIEGDDGFANNEVDGYSLSGTYAVIDSGFKMGLGLADQGDNNQVMLAASYELENLYFGALYGNAEVSNADVTSIELAAGYSMDKTVFTATYGLGEIEDETSAEAFAIDVTYYFQPNFRTYMTYESNMIENAEDEMALGLRYDF